MRSSSFMAQYKSFTTSHFDVEWNGMERNESMRARLLYGRAYSIFFISGFCLCVWLCAPHTNKQTHNHNQTNKRATTQILSQLEVFSCARKSQVVVQHKHRNEKQAISAYTQKRIRNTRHLWGFILLIAISNLLETTMPVGKRQSTAIDKIEETLCSVYMQSSYMKVLLLDGELVSRFLLCQSKNRFSCHLISTIECIWSQKEVSILLADDFLRVSSCSVLCVCLSRQ